MGKAVGSDVTVGEAVMGCWGVGSSVGNPSATGGGVTGVCVGEPVTVTIGSKVG